MVVARLLEKYFAPEALDLMRVHGRMVARKALRVAAGYTLGSPDLPFIREAALLHDIGVSRTHSPRLACQGDAPYICHGVLGREILESEGLPRHALVCERHIGVGLTVADIRQQNLPLPWREMTPVTLEERIIAYADLFFSKRPADLTREKPVPQVCQELAVYGSAKVAIFADWVREFEPDLALAGAAHESFGPPAPASGVRSCV